MLVAELEAFLHRLVADNMFSGAVLVAKDGDPIFRKAYGLASKRFDIPNRVDTKFNVGSLNKMFTAVAIAQLAEQGKLSLNDPVSKHLRDYPSEVADKVTVHHLLTHTSGLGEFLKDDVFTGSKTRPRTVEDHVPLFVDDSLSFEPGARFRYSNAGFIVLGAIMEEVSGKTISTMSKSTSTSRPA